MTPALATLAGLFIWWAVFTGRLRTFIDAVVNPKPLTAAKG